MLCKPLVLLPSKALSQNVSRLVIGGQVVKGDLTRLNLVVQEMVTNVDMFGAVVELRVLCDSNCRLVVNVKWDRER